MKLVLASNNKHKAEEYSAMFKADNGIDITVLLPKDLLHEEIEIEETGLTFEENASIKARHIFELAKLPCFSDDSGLEVKALGNKPGLNSARYSGSHGDDKANRKKVISELIDLNTDDWSARFRCVICFYDGLNEYFFEGICTGKLISEEKGTSGFGYDPIFIPDGYNITFAEMPSKQKNSISHRANAVDKFQQFLKEYNG
ncbi:MAG: RdgB/HAM1 family non-canonical purine NTP pyrophosphatase [bacterium]